MTILRLKKKCNIKCHINLFIITVLNKVFKKDWNL